MSEEKSGYTPIPCGLYSEYEVAILHATRLLLRWRDGTGGERRAEVLPLDLKTEQGIEYLLAEGEGGERLTIRLDRILERERAGHN